MTRKLIIHPTLVVTVLVLWSFSVTGQVLSMKDKGKQGYMMNCMACHQTSVKVVAPSLVTIAKTYPKDKRAEFIQWAKAPSKKDPTLLQMPPMAHVPEETLAAIHAFMLEEAKGKEEKRASTRYGPFNEPERELPYVVRAFLPDASPASVAVILKNNISVCWDTEACRFRYAWPGSKTRLRARQTVVDLETKPFYRETSDQLWSFAGDTKPEFHGYRLQKDGSPEFAYSMGDIEVRERISNGSISGSFVRHFTLSRAVDQLHLNLERDTSASLVANKGELKNNTLMLRGDDTQSFSLTISNQ